jgi:DNA-binding MarR family transcriptional regulator
MAQTVSELQAGGLLTRRPDPSDRRRALVELTERGRVVLWEDRGRREGWLASAIAADLNAEEQAVLRQAVALLERLAEH